MIKILNIIMFLLIITFILSIFYYYSSDKNVDAKNYNRKNIDQILKEKNDINIRIRAKTVNV